VKSEDWVRVFLATRGIVGSGIGLVVRCLESRAEMGLWLITRTIRARTLGSCSEKVYNSRRVLIPTGGGTCLCSNADPKNASLHTADHPVRYNNLPTTTTCNQFLSNTYQYRTRAHSHGTNTDQLKH